MLRSNRDIDMLDHGGWHEMDRSRLQNESDRKFAPLLLLHLGEVTDVMYLKLRKSIIVVRIGQMPVPFKDLHQSRVVVQDSLCVPISEVCRRGTLPFQRPLCGLV